MATTVADAPVESREYNHSPKGPDETLRKLFQRGSVTVKIDEVVAGYAAQGVEKTPAEVLNVIRSGVRMAGGQMLAGVVKTEVVDNKLNFRLTGDTFPIPENLPRFIKAMMAKGNKFSPTVAKALKDLGHDVEVSGSAIV